MFSGVSLPLISPITLKEGAHDDGTGIVQSLEVAYLFKKNNIKPKKHTESGIFYE